MIYLYVKTHPTGLKYLGKTVNDPHKYKGSGTHWIRHLKKHGEQHHTKILFKTNNKELLKKMAIYFSKLWSVSESKEWANIVPEQGDGGDTSMSPAYINYLKTRPKRFGENNTFFGMTHSKETKRKISRNRKSKGTGPKKWSKEGLARIGKAASIRNKGKVPWNKGKTGLQKHTLEQIAKKSHAVIYNGIEYISINEAERQTGISAYKIKKHGILK